ncbi:type II secretion system F family protein [Xylanimonas ulmi]|uniref:Tight adherence protein B n=1 Tax=Xylanimonas ulmi TaxID=228973 RepID=A0A4Q7M4N8_9MICO|nr:hypothetical protein [Xylanibacterium ulmi]RZS62916.1 tight adherence protein B [Xylanibacterium ulmi]
MTAAGGGAQAVVLGVAVTFAVWVGLDGGGRRACDVLGRAPGGRGRPDGPRGAAREPATPLRTGDASGPQAWRATALRVVSARRGGASRDEGARVRVVVAQVVALLRAGAPPGAAWTRAAGVPVDGLGVPEAAALATVVGDAPARAVAAATRLALTVGAPLGRVLEAVSDTLAAQAESDAEREAALAGPRATARVLLWLPAVGALLGWALGADPWAAATDGGPGTAAVAGGLVLLAVGHWWTGRLVETARRVEEAT